MKYYYYKAESMSWQDQADPVFSFSCNSEFPALVPKENSLFGYILNPFLVIERV